MQPQFVDSITDGLIEAVWTEIEVAKNQRRHIVVVEYGGFGWTDFALIDALRSYDRYTVVPKSGGNGAPALIELGMAREHNYRSMHWGTPRGLEVCGINRCACVAMTIGGILDSKEFKWVDELILLDHATGCASECSGRYCLPEALIHRHSRRLRRSAYDLVRPLPTD